MSEPNHGAASAEDNIPQSLKFDLDVTLDFLREFHPESPWCLTAICPDSRKIETRTFYPNEPDDCFKWLQRWVGKRNLYFHVNPVRGRLTKKARREDITAVHYLHVDLDPRVGENRDLEINRLRELLVSVDPMPTVTVFSGGGWQGFWKLREPISLDGSDTTPADAALYNQRLEQALGGDNCHNIDRLMRLPGTVNWPDKRKRARGRVPVVTELGFCATRDPDRIYPLERFERAQAQSVAPVPGTPAPNVRVQLDGLPDVNLDEVEGLLPDTSKLALRLGYDPHDLTRWTKAEKIDPDSWDATCDRSEVLYHVACALVRAELEDAAIAAVLVHPEVPVSQHVRSQGDGSAPTIKAYLERQIRRAQEAVSEEAESQAVAAGGALHPPPTPEADQFITDKHGVPVPQEMRNIQVALLRLNAQVQYDEFAGRYLLNDGPMQDEEMQDLRLLANKLFKLRCGKDWWFENVMHLARFHNKFHPVRDYLDSLTWDGTPRLGEWLIQYGEAEDTPFVRAVSRLMLVAAVRRIRRPGCKFDEMLVLESPQGSLKSTALAVLAGNDDWFTDDLPLNAKTAEFIERLRGRWIVEAAELNGMRKGEVEHVKSVLSRQVDRARMAYGRMTLELPRQCVFFGTTNADKYLKDSTGNRRFWPVATGTFDIEGLRAVRDQLWAEAAAAEADGEGIRLDPALYDAATEAQEERVVRDPWVDLIGELLGDLNGKLPVSDAWDLVGVPGGRQTQNDNQRLGDAMRELGWERKRLRIDGKPTWCYVRGTDHQRSTPLKVNRVGDSVRIDSELPF